MALVGPPCFSKHRRVKPGPLGIVVSSLLASLVASSTASAQAPKKPPTVINPPPSAQDWAELAKLPDWSGVWIPNIGPGSPGQNQSAALERRRRGKSRDVRGGKGRRAADRFELPAGIHPTWMLVTHNALEFLFTPGRVTMLG